MIYTSTPGADLAAQDFADAIFLKTNTPLVATDNDGKAVYDYHGHAQIRNPSRQAVELSRGSLLDAFEWAARATGPASLSRDLSKMNTPQKAKLFTNRLLLSKYYPSLPPTNKISADAVMLSLTTGDFPSAMADTANKLGVANFALTRRLVRATCRTTSVQDFKTADRPRLKDVPGLIELAEGETINFGAVEEAASEQFAIGRFGRGFRFSRESLLNDDANLLGEIGRVIGQGAGRLPDKLFFALLAANANAADGNPLFSTSRGNVTTGALTVSSLGTARQKLSGLTAPDGDILDVQAGILLVPTGLTATGEQLLSSLVQINPHEVEQPIRVISSGHLDAISSSQWYVMPDPMRMPAFEMAYLRGQEQPRIDGEVHFDSGAMKFRAIMECQVSAIDPRLCVRSTGS